MSFRQAIGLQLGFVLLSTVITVWFALRLPDVVPIHWNATGTVDSYGSKWITLLAMPITVMVIAVVHVALPYFSPKQFEVTNSGGAYHAVMLLVNGIMVAIQVVILEASSNIQFGIERWMWIVIWAFFALLGSQMGKLKRNFYVGIKTPWTLADDTVWNESHRAAGAQWMGVGILGLVLALFGVPIWFHVPLLILVCIWPIAQSYGIYKKRMGR